MELQRDFDLSTDRATGSFKAFCQSMNSSIPLAKYRHIEPMTFWRSLRMTRGKPMRARFASCRTRHMRSEAITVEMQTAVSVCEQSGR